MNRSDMREKCMVILYQINMHENKKLNYDINEIILDNVKHSNDFIDGLVYGTMKNINEINEMANKYMIDWTIDRIDRPGAEILRIGFYELMYTDTPKIVVINEAIELAKKYSDESVKNIINAALDKYIKEV
ncbi:MAG: transcription antitermination factor NusB [bacterium]